MIKKNQTVGNQENVTVVEFGTGDVGLATGLFENDPQKAILVVLFQDEPKPVEQWARMPTPGITTDDLKDPVILKFPRLESINSLIDTLYEAKERFIAKQRSNEEW